MGKAKSAPLRNRKPKSGTATAKSRAPAEPPAYDDDQLDQGEEDVELGRFSVLGTILVGLLHIGVYYKTLYPTVPGGDSGELISTAHVLGVAHPPGYPLFIMLFKAFFVLVPYGSIAWRANLLSSLFASGAGVLIHRTARKLTRRTSAGFVAVALFSFARLQWLYAITGEVFAFNNFLVAALVHQLVYYWYAPTDTKAFAGALLCGIAMSNQHTSVLYIVVVAPAVLWRGRATLFTPANVAVLVLAVLVGMSPYAFMVYSAWKNTATLTWGNQASLAGFVKHFFRQEYGTFDLAKGNRESASFWLAIQMHAKSFSTETFHIGLPLAALGSLGPLCLDFRLRSTKTQALLALQAMLVFYVGFFNWRANLDMTNPLLAGVQERFWMQPNVILVILAATGYTLLTSKLGRVLPLLLASGIVAAQVGTNFAERDESDNYYVRDFGRALLEDLPNNSIMLMYGDLPGNAARYVQACDGIRPDVRVIDLEMMTFEWYLEMLEHSFPGVTFPAKNKVFRHGDDFFDMKKFFDANIDRFDIFVFENLNPEDSSWVEDYEIWRHGMVRAIKRKGTKLDPKAWLKTALPAVPTFPLPDPIKYDNRTWERVVFDGMLSSGVYLAIFFEERASAAVAVDRKEGVALYKAALEVYEYIYAAPAYTPYREAYWSKNHGIVAWSLMNHDPKNTKTYKPIVIQHWQAYIDSDAHDPQKKDMQSMIDNMAKA